MTALAILFMLVAVSSVTTLAAWCYYRVLLAGTQPAGTNPTANKDA